MRISFRLKELLREHRVLERGVIKRIADATSLERHQVAAILENRAKYVSMDTLAALCKYLIEEHNIARAELPGKLFRIESERFSALIAGRKYVELCTGMWTARKGTGGHEPFGERDGPLKNGPLPKRRWVMASDSYLQGILLHELFALANERHPDAVELRLVPASIDHTENAVLESIKYQAQKIYEDFQNRTDDRALVCLGSVKSNVVIERVIAAAFQAEPFTSQDTVKRAKDRRCPFFLRYRADDIAQPPSCHGGHRLARSKQSPQPGIYYETPKGWQCCPCTRNEDAALVFYAYHVPVGRLEMVLGGFSGRATHCLALGLHDISSRLWPPNYDTSALQVGAFVVRFEFDCQPNESEPRSDGDPEAELRLRPSLTKVIPIEEEVLREKVEREREE